jgi:hypothetical protein
LLPPRKPVAPAHLLAFDLAWASVLGELLAEIFSSVGCPLE